jgi:branched-chain amino acid transport system permease protein
MTAERRALIIKVVVGALLLALLLYLPQYFKPFQVGLFNKVFALALAAVGLNLLTGYGGLISLGHGAFFGIGAYTTAVLVADHDWPHFATLGAAALLCFVVGALVGLPALRIKGLYLALVTLALATLFPELIKRFSDITGGTQGKTVPLPKRFRAPEWTGLADDQWKYYVFLAILVVAMVLVRNLVRSRVGRALIATRDNETAAEAMGVNLAAYRIITFGISAMLAGIGGCLWVWNSSSIDSGQVGIDLSINLLVAVVIGGAATIVGPALGTYLLVFIPQWLPQERPELSPVLFGLSLILLMRVAPGGILGLARSVPSSIRARWPRTPAASDA